MAVVGAGAMGSVYAGLLATAGHEVWAVDRREDLVGPSATSGLRVAGASGDRTVRIGAATDPAEAGEAELVVLATKAMAATAAAEGARPLLGPETLVLSIQNGLGGPDAAAAVLGADRVAVGVVGGFGASVVAPGHAHHNGMELVRLGEHSGPVTPRIGTVADVWRQAGFTVRTSTTSTGSSGRSSSATSPSRDLLGDRTHGRRRPSPTSMRGRSPRSAPSRRTRWRGRWDRARLRRPRRLRARLRAGHPRCQALDAARPAGRAPTEIDAINGAIPRAGVGVGLAAPFNEAVSALVRALELGTLDSVLEELALPWAPTA